MKRDGFTLVELVVAMAIIGILLAIGTLQFNKMTRKSGIDAQTRMLYTDLMSVRAQALTQKKPRAVSFAGARFAIYPSYSTAGVPTFQRTLKYPLIPSGNVRFDTTGIASWSTADANLAFCVESSDSASYDSIIIGRTRIRMGLRKKNAGCTFNDFTTANIVAK